MTIELLQKIKNNLHFIDKHIHTSQTIEYQTGESRTSCEDIKINCHLEKMNQKLGSAVSNNHNPKKGNIKKTGSEDF
jgi:hypothetical protein